MGRRVQGAGVLGLIALTSWALSAPSAQAADLTRLFVCHLSYSASSAPGAADVTGSGSCVDDTGAVHQTTMRHEVGPFVTPAGGHCPAELAIRLDMAGHSPLWATWTQTAVPAPVPPLLAPTLSHVPVPQPMTGSLLGSGPSPRTMLSGLSAGAALLTCTTAPDGSVAETHAAGTAVFQLNVTYGSTGS